MAAAISLSRQFGDGRSTPRSTHQPGDSAIHRAGIEERQARAVRATPRAVLDLPEPLGPSMATTSEAGGPSRITLAAVAAQTRGHLTDPSDTSAQPRPLAARRSGDVPAIGWSSVGSSRSARSGVDREGQISHWRAWSCSIEMSSTLTPAAPTSENKRASAPGWSGISTTTWLYVTGRRRACRESYASQPLLAPAARGDCGPGAASSAWIMTVSSSRTWCSSDSTAAELAPRICSHRSGRCRRSGSCHANPGRRAPDPPRGRRSGGPPSALTSDAADGRPLRPLRHDRRRP